MTKHRILYDANVFWDDVRFPASTGQTAAANKPTWAKVNDNGAGSRGVYGWTFSAGANEYLDHHRELPHTYAEGNDGKFHIHWRQLAAGAGNVVLGIELEWSNSTGMAGNTSVHTVTVAVPGTVMQRVVTPIVTLPGAGKLISSLIDMTVFRLGADAADTYAGGIHISDVGMHTLFNSPGSVQEYVKGPA